MYQTLGKRIRKLRKDKGLTQEELGKLVNKGGSTVRMWELDGAQPSPDTLCLLCGIFNTTPNFLLGWDNPSESPPLSLLLLTELIQSIEQKYPDMSSQKKATLIFEFNQHDPVELLLSALNNELEKKNKGSDKK